MTIAICLRCGAQKIGALTRCVGCDYDPVTDADRRNQAKSLWLSDHHLAPEALAAFAALLKAGAPVTWNEPVLDALVTQLQTQQNPLLKAPIGCSYFVWGLVALMFGLLGLVIFLATLR